MDYLAVGWWGLAVPEGKKRFLKTEEEMSRVELHLISGFCYQNLHDVSITLKEMLKSAGRKRLKLNLRVCHYCSKSKSKIFSKLNNDRHDLKRWTLLFEKSGFISIYSSLPGQFPLDPVEYTCYLFPCWILTAKFSNL